MSVSKTTTKTRGMTGVGRQVRGGREHLALHGQMNKTNTSRGERGDSIGCSPQSSPEVIAK